MVELIVVNLHQVVRQMPTMASSKQPTIAVITAQYCEKLAVDSMLENKETFVRYTTVGKHSVFIDWKRTLSPIEYICNCPVRSMLSHYILMLLNFG
jgi:hypothetical protein